MHVAVFYGKVMFIARVAFISITQQTLKDVMAETKEDRELAKKAQAATAGHTKLVNTSAIHVEVAFTLTEEEASYHGCRKQPPWTKCQQ